MAVLDPGSFRDPSSRVYIAEDRVYRGLNKTASDDFALLLKTVFYQRSVEEKDVIGSGVAPIDDPSVRRIKEDGWHTILTHPMLRTITFPYEWTFSMLQDAALLHLKLLKAAFQEGFTLKDASAFNMQFVGTKPIFIDVPSFVPRYPNEPWLAYRQFCMQFLYPLMLRAYTGIEFQQLLKSSLDGVSPETATNLLRGWAGLRRGVLSHVRMPAALEARSAKRNRDNVPAAKVRNPKQSDHMVFSLFDSVERLVASLKSHVQHTNWSQYVEHNSYSSEDQVEKVAFVRSVLSQLAPSTVWDLGCNTGSFSELAAQFSSRVIAVDGDHDSVEKLYLRLRRQDTITPLFMDLSNPSPDLGWANNERPRFSKRNAPDVILCLALIHHIRLSANVPFALFFAWLQSFRSNLIIEFVDRHDDMVVKLLAHKREQYEDYSKGSFERELAARFRVVASTPIKDGSRTLYYCQPS